LILAACDYLRPLREDARSSSETQRPLAVVIIGRLSSATVLVLIGLPALYLAAPRHDFIPSSPSLA
jgi:Cu/Ag efflux pump CusA